MPLCCQISSDVLFVESIRAIIKANKMNFYPRKFPDSCSDTYRVSQATCWASWVVVLGIDGISSNSITLFVTKPCNELCCSRKLRVCRNEDGSVDITDLGPGELQSNCDNVTLTLPDQILNCNYSCSYLENIQNPSPFPKNVVFPDVNETTENMITSNMNSVFVKQNNSTVNVTYNNIGYGKINLQVFGILGNLIQENSYSLVQGTNSYEFDLNTLPNGVYFYSILIDDVQIFTNKIILVR